RAVSLWIDNGRVFRPGARMSGGYAVRPADAGPLRTVELSVLWCVGPAGAAGVGGWHYGGDQAGGRDDLSLYRKRHFQGRLADGPLSYDGQVAPIRWLVPLRLRYINGEELVRELPFRLGAHAPN